MTVVERASMHPGSGLDYAANGTEYDITLWRQNQATAIAAIQGNSDTLVTNSGLIVTSNAAILAGVTTPADSNVQLINGNGNPVSIDVSTRAQISIGYAHHEMHDDNHFYIQGFLELGDDDTYYVKLVTPNTGKWAHFLYDISSIKACTTYFDEDASGGMEDGSPVVPINNNRNSDNLSGMVLTGNVTNATGYLKRLESNKWGAGEKKLIVGGGGGREDELMLKQDTVYLRTFISNAASNIIQFKASWYEHSNRTD